MSFLASCPFCSAKPRFSSKLLGSSVECPDCGNRFTAAPFEEIAAGPSRYRHVGTPARVSAVPEETADRHVQEESQPSENSSAASLEGEATFRPPIPDWVNLWGASGLVITSLAFLWASLGLTRRPAILLACCGALLCLLGYILGSKNKAKDGVWLIGSGVLALLFLIVACCWPHLINRFWAIDFAVPVSDPNQQKVVSRNNQVTGPVLDEQRWVDAEKEAVRQGDIHVRVESVKLEPGAKRNAGEADDEARLLVTMRVSNAGQLHRYVYQSPNQDNASLQLRDDRGKSYVLKKSSVTRQSTLKPLQNIHDVLSFEAPQPGVDHLELEFPASAWNGKGVCRFRIGSAMISVPPKE